jgi:plasmid replication initiation protein
VYLNNNYTPEVYLFNSNLIAYKSRWLVEASYKLTLQEQRFMLCCVAKINPQIDIPDSITIHSEDFYIQFPDMGKENSERELKKAVDRLWERSIIVKDPNQTEEFRWIQRRVKYHEGEGKVTVSFSKDIAKYLTQLSGQFAKVTLNNISGLKSVYSIRIYELLQQFIKAGNRLITVEDFRFLLDLGDSYPQFKSLNRSLIQPSLREINLKSNIKVKVQQVKKGRKIHAIHFIFEEKEQLEFNV